MKPKASTRGSKKVLVDDEDEDISQISLDENVPPRRSSRLKNKPENIVVTTGDISSSRNNVKKTAYEEDIQKLSRRNRKRRVPKLGDCVVMKR